MEGKKPLIVGIDPGTTTAYSIIDFEGRLIKLESAKNLGINSLIRDIVKEGKVILVGTDKAKVPSLVENFAAKVGARLVHSKEDLKITEKRSLVGSSEAKDEHQFDALASSLFAFNSIKNMVKRIDLFLSENNKDRIRNRVLELVLLNGISLRNAIDIIEKPEKEEVRIIKRVIEENKPNKSDFIRLYNRLKLCEREILFLKKQNINLKNSIKDTENRYNRLLRKTNDQKFDEKAEKLISYKEKRILLFDSKLKEKDDELNYMKENSGKLDYFLANMGNFYFAKKLKNLGSSEFNEKSAVLGIRDGDMLLVDDPNTISENVISMLKGRIGVILHKGAASEKTKGIPGFMFIDCKPDFETRHFGFVKKEAIDKEIKKINLISKVIEDYKKEKC